MSLSGRLFRVALSAAALTFGSLTAHVASAAEVTLRLATVAPEKSVWGEMLNNYAKRVGELSGGEVNIEIFPSGQLGSMANTLSQMRRGRLDMWTGAVTELAGLAPALNALLLPYLLKDDAEVACVADKIYDRTQELLAKDGQFLGFMPIGWHHISNRTPVQVPADIQNLKMRTNSSPISVALFRAYGSNPVPLDPGETASALSTGLVDGSDSSLTFWFASGEVKPSPHFLKLRHYYNWIGLVVGSQSWSQLSPAHQQALIDARDVLKFADLTTMVNDFEARAIKGATEAGATILEPSAEQRESWVELGVSTWPALTEGYDATSKAYFDLIEATKSECAG